MWTYTWVFVFHYFPEFLVTKEVIINIEILVKELIRELEEDIGKALDCHHYSTLIPLNPFISRYNPVHMGEDSKCYHQKIKILDKFCARSNFTPRTGLRL